jgi:hypothetical protein
MHNSYADYFSLMSVLWFGINSVYYSELFLGSGKNRTLFLDDVVDDDDDDIPSKLLKR